ncbi:MAG: c-type cytochrome [Nitrosomonadales bacterium]|nr:c-type cytochrome [Nitrosomonadales bacterium]
MKRLFILAVLFSSAPVLAVDGMAILQRDCAVCHSLTGPAAQTLKDAWSRKGPDLFYAGNKYRAEWMTAWLQKPQAIRPAGLNYGEHLKAGVKGDEVDTATLPLHPVLAKADAVAVTAELMKLKPHDDLISKEKLESGSISKQMGEMAFDKFYGCLACHQIEPEFGGFSGPELYTAAQRLQPEFMASLIRSPQAWNPKSWMPNKQLTDMGIQKMVRYLDVIGKESANAK